MKDNARNNLFFAIKILAGIGILLSTYLLWEQFFHPAFQPCSINTTVNCDAIVSGAVSKTVGIQTPLIGLAGYIIILCAAVLKKKKFLLSMATFGLAFCLWIGYKELFELHVVCPVCIGCELIMTTVFVLSIVAIRKNERFGT